MRHQVGGSAYYENRPGATKWEKDLADAKQPKYTRIYNGRQSENQPDGGFDIERFLHSDPCVVIATTRPPWGEWEELESWETS